LGRLVYADLVLCWRELLPELGPVELLHEDGRALGNLRFRRARAPREGTPSWGFEPQSPGPEPGSLSKLAYEGAGSASRRAIKAFPVRGYLPANSVYPHLPQLTRSPCFARNTPAPHFGQNGFSRWILSPSTL